MAKSTILNQDLIDREDSAATNPLWTVEDVAHYLRLRPETVRAMVRRGELPGMKVGRVWRFRADSVKKRFVKEGIKD